MNIIDSKGRLFGRINILDLGAILVVVLTLIGIFVVPGPKGTIAQMVGGGGEKVEVELLVRGLSVRNGKQFMQSLKGTDVKILVRNEPAGSLTIDEVEELPRYVLAPQPDGSLKPMPDPRPVVDLSTDMIIYMHGRGLVTDDGVVLANQKVKIGTVLELDGSTYNFRGSVIDVHKAS